MTPEGTMFWGVVLKQFLLGASAFSVGVLLYRTITFDRKRHRPFLGIGFTGMAIALGLIAEAVLRQPLVPPSFRAVLYLTALFMISVGFLGDVIRGKRRAKRGEK